MTSLQALRTAMKINKQQQRPTGIPRASPTPSCYEGSVDDDAVSIQSKFSTHSKQSHISALSHLLPAGSENGQTAISEISCNTATSQYIDMENINADGKVPYYVLNPDGKLSQKRIAIGNQSVADTQAESHSFLTLHIEQHFVMSCVICQRRS